MSDTATINLFEKIPLTLKVVRKDTGEEVPQAVLSDVIWNQDNQIGVIAPDANDPKLALFTPNKAGITNITASASVTIP